MNRRLSPGHPFADSSGYAADESGPNVCARCGDDFRHEDDLNEDGHCAECAKLEAAELAEAADEDAACARYRENVCAFLSRIEKAFGPLVIVPRQVTT